MIDRFARWSRGCLTIQGYAALGEADRRKLWLGLRFAPALCLAGVAVGTAAGSPTLLLALAATALVGGFLAPKHPFDYAYDLALRPLLGGPRIPPSPAPRRFACQLATPWISAVAVALLAGSPTLAWVLAAPMLASAVTVTATNWCMPSFVYGRLLASRAASPPAPTSSP